MDLRQFGEYNQFKILRQTATRESKKYLSLFQLNSIQEPTRATKKTVDFFFVMWLSLDLDFNSHNTSKMRKAVISSSKHVLSQNSHTCS